MKQLQDFYEKFNNQKKYKVVYSEDRDNKLREYQQNKRENTENIFT